MLRPAYYHQQELQDAIENIMFNDKYKYWNFQCYWEYDPDISKDSWNNICLVSMYNNKIIGYLNAAIDRSANNVSSLSILNFSDNKIAFGKDFCTFIKDLFFKYNFRKISFMVAVGNPIEASYDKFINKHGGRVCGIQKEHIMLQDGKYYDVKNYEIFKRDYK